MGGTNGVIRAAGLQAVDTLLGRAAARPSALVVAGEAGIGKTTLLSHALEQAAAQGFRVLTARTGEAESVLAYAAIADLLSGVEESVLGDLSELHRLAIDRVLLRADGDGPPTDQRVTGAALVSVVTRLALTAPVLLAVDDAQWLDSSSQPVLAFAVRRLAGRVGVILTERTSSADVEAAPWLVMTAPDEVARIRVGPMGLDAITEMIRGRLDRSLARPTLARIAEASGGNPFYALELARAVDGRSVSDDGMLPGTLADLMRLRTGHFSTATGDLLLAAGCVADATVALLAQATDSSARTVRDLLAQPVRDGIVVIDGDRVRFSHPLLARGVYTEAGPARRRRMHRTLAAVEVQPELKARHLALGAASADPHTLAALDDAAAAAQDRGAAVAAAELYELAIGLGGDTPGRRILAATAHFRSGDTGRARDLVESTLTDQPPGLARSSALLLAGGVRISEHDYPRAIGFLHGAARDAEESSLHLAQADMGLALAYGMLGRRRAAARHAVAAVAHAEVLASPALLSQALALHVLLACGRGEGRDEQAMQRALELEDPDSDVPAPFRARVSNAMTLAWTGRLEEARAIMLAVRGRCVEQGWDSDLLYVSSHLAMADVWLSRYDDAHRVAVDTLQRAEQSNNDYSITMARVQVALVGAYRGDEVVAHNEIRAALEGAQRCGSELLAAWPVMILGFLEVSRGDHAAALKALAPCVDRFAATPGTEILSSMYIPDAVEAMVAVGRLDDAEPMVDALERNGTRLDRTWMLAVGARCRAMLLAGRGDLAAAEAMAARAMAAHDRLPMPFERARTQLLVGQLARRRRRKQAAAQVITEAMTVFEDLGAVLWVERARAELARANVARGRDSALTPSEASVARLAVAGMSNRDIAAALFITPKTVEHNLSRVYRKLGVRARTELARHSAVIDR